MLRKKLVISMFKCEISRRLGSHGLTSACALAISTENVGDGGSHAARSAHVPASASMHSRAGEYLACAMYSVSPLGPDPS